MIWSVADAEREARERTEAFQRLADGKAMIVTRPDVADTLRCILGPEVEIHGSHYFPTPGIAWIIDKPPTEAELRAKMLAEWKAFW